MSKLSLHCQGVPGWVGAFLARGRCSHIKGIGNYPTYPGVTTIGRVYYDQGKVDQRVREGAAGANTMFDACWPEVEKNSQVHIWETPANEASIWQTDVANGYVDFSQRMAYRFQSAGKKIIVGAVNVGWPLLPHQDGGAMMRLVQRAARGADGLSFHEYGWEDMRAGASYYCLRYRRFHDFTQGDHPPLYITECGLDRTAPPGPDFGHSGWRAILNGDEDAYIEQLLWYESELRQDDYVQCATIFTAGPSGWGSFEMYEGVSMKLADGLAALEPGPPEPPEPPDPEPPGGDVITKIFDAQGNEQDMTWLEETYGPVGVEATADAGYGIVELRETKNTHATLVVSVRDENDDPLQNVSVNFGWPDGSVFGQTNINGDVGFGMGNGAYYWPPAAGPHWVKCGGVTVDGLGMLGGTNHDHLDVVFREGEPEPPSPPPPPPDDDYNPLPGVTITGQDGQSRTAEWADIFFGYQGLHKPDSVIAYRLVGLLAQDDTTAPELRVFVLGIDGNPAFGVKVLLGSRSIDPPVRMSAYTDVDGIATFDISADWLRFSAVDQQGPAAVAIGNGDSDVYESAGVVTANPPRHLNLVLRLMDDTIPPPEPPDEDWAWLTDRLDRIIELLTSIDAKC